jgi:hypothetical protein
MTFTFADPDPDCACQSCADSRAAIAAKAAALLAPRPEPAPKPVKKADDPGEVMPGTVNQGYQEPKWPAPHEWPYGQRQPGA